MAQLLIRDLDAKTIERLKERAKLNRRSLQGELRLILEREAAVGREDSWSLAKRIRGAFDNRRFSDSTALIREDRDR
jgi:plasmid stability protein